MADLKALAVAAGFQKVRTYIASGNLLFDSDLDETGIKSVLERALAEHAGKPIGVAVRTAAEMAQVLTDSPFADRPPNRTVAIFLDAPPAVDALETVAGRRDEDIALGKREIYVAYGDGIADSKLRIPAAKTGTARNMNTVAKLAELAGAD